MTSRGHTDSESGHIREVYSHFGLAMYQAQCLERQLAIILATKYRPDPFKISRTELENILEALFLESLGQLVSKIKELSELSEDEAERLTKALRIRNWLAHRYFWERPTELLSESGRASMIKELQDAAHLFDTLDKLLTDRTVEWLGTVGVTQQILDEKLERLVGNRRDQ